MIASDLRSPATCARSRSHRSRTSDAGSVPDQGDRRVDLGAARRHPRVAGGNGVLDDALGRRRRLVIPAGRPVDDDPQPPRACQSCAIAGRFEDRNRVRSSFQRAGAGACVAGIDLHVPLVEDGAGFQSGIPDRGRRGRRLVERRRGLRERAPLQLCLAEIHLQLDPLGIADLAKRGGALQQVRCRRKVAAGEGPPAGGAKTLGRAGADLSAFGVDRAELRPVAECLLEVVAEDLLELLLAVAFAVDLLGPRDEALVERRPCPLEQRVVGGVADEDVVEAIRVGVIGCHPVIRRSDELLATQGRQVLRRDQASTDRERARGRPVQGTPARSPRPARRSLVPRG